MYSILYLYWSFVGIFVHIFLLLTILGLGFQGDSCAGIHIGITSNGNLNRFGWSFTIILKLSVLNLNRKTQSNECGSLQYTMKRLSLYHQTAMKYILNNSIVDSASSERVISKRGFDVNMAKGHHQHPTHLPTSAN